MLHASFALSCSEVTKYERLLASQVKQNSAQPNSPPKFDKKKKERKKERKDDDSDVATGVIMLLFSLLSIPDFEFEIWAIHK